MTVARARCSPRRQHQRQWRWAPALLPKRRVRDGRREDAKAVLEVGNEKPWVPDRAMRILATQPAHQECSSRRCPARSPQGDAREGAVVKRPGRKKPQCF
mmetsp:Transcript_33964/g.94019  ORF Transcript_33964/g.94019 Transcript_33964/m.94019 type:complete len:100 (-) Transcript_33964:97-396(-)